MDLILEASPHFFSVRASFSVAAGRDGDRATSSLSSGTLVCGGGARGSEVAYITTD
jgi:hypothetical protein